MPRKRNNNWSRNKKQKQNTTARLIEISMKVDDYVYNQKPISEFAAKSYLAEVTYLQEQCANDERSLQVIEKLTRCMKAIIIEHRQRGGACDDYMGTISIHDVRSNSTSPVYSLPDEDRIIFTQIAENNTETAKDVANGQGIPDSDVIDLCSDDEDMVPNKITKTAADIPNFNTDVEVDIQRGISNLSLTQNRSPHNDIVEGVHSQSILHNYEDEGLSETSESNIVSKITNNTVTSISNINNNYDISAANKNLDLWRKNNEPVHNNADITSVIDPPKSIASGITQNINTPGIPLFNLNRFSKTQDSNNAKGAGTINAAGSVPLFYSDEHVVTGSQINIANNAAIVYNSSNFNHIPVHMNIFSGTPIDTNSKATVNPIVRDVQNNCTNQNSQTKIEANQNKLNSVTKEVQRVETYADTASQISQSHNTTTLGAWNTGNNNIPESQDTTHTNVNTYSQGLMHSVHNNIVYRKPQAATAAETQNTITNGQANNCNQVYNDRATYEETYLSKFKQYVKKPFEAQTNKLDNDAAKQRVVIIEDKTKVKKRRPRKKRCAEEVMQTNNKKKQSSNKANGVLKGHNISNLDETESQPNLKIKQAPNKSKKVTKQAFHSLTKNDPKVTIYNANVENDLSWMENIRYVREIERDEIDTKLNFDDSFWDNYNVPENWNDTDFLY